jgi:hypothetical protein
MQKEKWPSRQFTRMDYFNLVLTPLKIQWTDYLNLVLTPLRIRWTIPLTYGFNLYPPLFKFLYIMYFTRKEKKTVQIRVSKRGDKRSTWLISLGELVSYAMSYSAQCGVEKERDVHYLGRERKRTEG